MKEAIRASISLPIVFDPLVYTEYLLVDGALVEAVPIQAAKEMGAQRVIGVNLYSNHTREEIKKDLSMIDVAKYSIDIALHTIAEQNMKDADIQLNIPIKDIALTEFVKDPSEYIKLGYDTTLEQTKALKRL